MSKYLGLDMAQLSLYKDNQLMAFNKPPGIAVQSQAKPDLHQLANAYAQIPLHVVHRIDQPASGLVLFAKNAKAAAHMQHQFATGSVRRSYHALVKKLPVPNENRLQHFLLKMNRQNKSLVVDTEVPGAQSSVLTYRWISSSDTYHLLEIFLSTGRHHQIRAQLAAIGSPIKGDVKYGDRRSNRDRSIHLHASGISVDHPVSGESIHISAPAPDEVLWNFFREEMTGVPESRPDQI
ncbi:MAG: RluA family pseudouridine synthase [Saprospiraceae bacterium]|nr:RluA family pseudouridine synthase [Saprospiraceae bacterium]